jgi:hypothetical protein
VPHNETLTHHHRKARNPTANALRYNWNLAGIAMYNADHHSLHLLA